MHVEKWPSAQNNVCGSLDGQEAYDDLNGPEEQ